MSKLKFFNMSNLSQLINKCSNFVKNNKITVALAILIVMLTGYILYSNNRLSSNLNNPKAQQDIAQDAQTQNTQDTQTSDSTNKPTTNPTQNSNNNAQNSNNGSQNGSNSENNNGSNIFMPKNPGDIIGQVNIPTPTPKPTSSGLGIDMNLINSMNIKDKISTGYHKIMPDKKLVKYLVYIGASDLIDDSLPANHQVFLDVNIDDQGNVHYDYYVIPNSNFDPKKDLKPTVHAVLYYASDDKNPINDKHVTIHLINSIDACNEIDPPFYMIVTGIYKGPASQTLGDKYIGYADLEIKSNGKPIHILISRAKTNKVDYKVGQKYKFMVTNIDYVDYTASIQKTQGNVYQIFED